MCSGERRGPPSSLLSRAAVLVLVLLFSSSALGSEPPTPHKIPGMESMPWGLSGGSVGDWVRYRVGNEHLQETSYMTLALVERDETGAEWLEIRVARSRGSKSGDLAVRALTRTEGDDLETRRMLVRMGGGGAVELDLDTLPDDEAGQSPLSMGGACASPESASCRRAVEEGLEVQERPPETILTAVGSLRVVPVHVRFEDGSVMTLVVSESVPITALVAASTAEGTHLELDGMGDGAEPTMPSSAEVVAYSELGDALSGGVAAGSALQEMGRLVNPDDEEKEGAERRPRPRDEPSDEEPVEKDGEEEEGSR